jgi:hypothetical protein
MAQSGKIKGMVFKTPNLMKTFNLLCIYSISAIILLPSHPAEAAAPDTNPPPRLTADLRDGSRVVGNSVETKFKFHSALFGDVQLAVEDVRLMEFVSSNSVKLKAFNGDTLVLQPAEPNLALKTGFGKVELAMDSIRKLSVAPGGTAVPQREGLMGFWAGNGNASDGLGEHPGLLMGGADFDSGPLGQTFHFNSSGSYVKIPKSSDLNPSGQVTIEFWMNADTANAMNNYQGLVASDFYGVEISNGYGGKMGVNFFLSTTANQPIQRYSGGGASAAYTYSEQWSVSGLRSRITSVANFAHISNANGGGAPVSAGQWHHIAATYDGNQMRLYIDGQPWGNPVSLTGTIVPMLPESFVAIGSEDGRTTSPESIGQRYFNGYISHVALYNRALTTAEIREDYEAANTR